ncbi:MAG: hypothetical protein R3B95_11530 [Nitrospirales bacterium]|nr:hypothetical protein [Nitrospirales bacterium]
MPPEIIAEGSREIINLFLQEDTDFDGKLNGAIDLSNASAVEVHLRKFSDGTELSFSTADVSSNVAIVDATGSSHTLNGKAASLVTLTIDAGVVSKADEGYDIYVVVKDAQGRPMRVPNKAYHQLLVLGEFE